MSSSYSRSPSSSKGGFSGYIGIIGFYNNGYTIFFSGARLSSNTPINPSLPNISPLRDATGSGSLLFLYIGSSI